MCGILSGTSRRDVFHVEHSSRAPVRIDDGGKCRFRMTARYPARFRPRPAFRQKFHLMSNRARHLRNKGDKGQLQMRTWGWPQRDFAGLSSVPRGTFEQGSVRTDDGGKMVHSQCGRHLDQPHFVRAGVVVQCSTWNNRARRLRSERARVTPTGDVTLARTRLRPGSALVKCSTWNIRAARPANR